MKERKCFLVFAALLSVLLLSGCGSSGGSGGDKTADSSEALGVDSSGVAFVGSAACIDCHEGFTWSDDLVDDYLASPHAGTADEQLSAAALSIDLTEAAAGCEACHGAGGEHYGVGPMPTPTPDVAACSECHDGVSEEYTASAHAGSINDHMGDHLPAGHRCVKCHTDEGALIYVNVDDPEDIDAIANGTNKDYTPVQCRTCHNAHNPQRLLEDEVLADHVLNEGTPEQEVIQVVVESAEYRTCMNCHGQDHLTSRAAWSFRDTHFDDAETADIEGYVINMTAENSCTVCHDVHVTDNTINNQWAESGHAAEIALVKAGEIEGVEGGVDAVISLDNEHHQHSVIAFTEIDIINDPARNACERCHTATGAHNYLSDPENYDPENNDFSYLKVLDGHANIREDIPQEKRELLYCTSCHSNAQTGELLVSGNDITLGYTYNSEEIVLAGVNQSKVCLSCHGAWGNNDSLVAMADDARDFHGVLHHGPAGGVLFAAQTHAGYEFAGQEYSSTGHDRIGTTDADGNEVVPGTGTAGPCVACHMPDNNHSNTVADGDELTSQAVCNVCHIGGTMTAEIIEAGNAGRAETASLIRSYIDATYGIKGVAAPDVPAEYFRAAMNWWVVYDDFGGHAHNPTYVKQIAFDTIDYLADGALDGVITIDVDAWPAAATWLGANPTTGETTRP